ncbi:beta-ketoacyl synthase chain length factor [Vibrio rumoiensis]|uniref:3-oxoacyl-ACP synthase n=1 Tax=Vibrio rumoiensis 1S-45 TaxID=1188252 RepID=A0A1E5E209_9VIBR|nr:beta-ketoacyl synthase chain length factor [Vibrio rumoiensis]OEF25454.1 3-oxoacyl-ACP synthase [Vibrio rumoiensis 1S-45]
MSKIAFTIEDWYALSPGLTDRSAWKRWAISEQWPTEPEALSTHLIPAMMRRRMSPLSKVALQTAMYLQQNLQQQQQSFDYLVFSSRHGELPRTVDLLQQVLQGEEASPMAFSQSVHNTSVGLFTIASKSPIPATSLAGCESSLHYALIEAYAYLEDNPEHKVLVLDFDAPLPQPYTVFEDDTHQPLYALGLVLRAGNNTELTWKPLENMKQPIIKHSLTLETLKQLALHEQQINAKWQISDSRTQWAWNHQ